MNSLGRACYFKLLNCDQILMNSLIHLSLNFPEGKSAISQFSFAKGIFTIVFLLSQKNIVICTFNRRATLGVNWLRCCELIFFVIHTSIRVLRRL